MVFHSFASERFWKLYQDLPTEVQRLADRQYEIFRQDPFHPSLHLKQIGEVWTVRIGQSYRAIGYREGDRFYAGPLRIQLPMSPDHPNPLVTSEYLVGGYDGYILSERLRQDLAVERIGVMPRQSKQPECMLARVGENANVQIRKRFAHIRFGQVQLAAAVLNGDLGH